MHARKKLIWPLTAALALVGSMNLRAQQPPPDEHSQHHPAAAPTDAEKRAEHQAVQSMAPGHHHEGPHMRMTAKRPQARDDLERADTVVRTLRTALEKYKDYRAAIADGYRPFLPNLPQPQYHFTDYWNGFLEAFTFDPSRPTSLLYRKTANGYELIGAMYTMPKNTTDDQLNARVPLSVGRWHAHINLCMPQKGQGARADWTKFGLAGSISTSEACAEAGGRFHPQIFGWMIHVYPFEDSLERIWAP